MLAPEVDNLWTQIGWAFYGSGTRAVTSIVYTVGPVLVTEAAKAQRLGDHSPPPTHAPPGNHSNASAALPADSDELPVVLADGVEVLATQLSTLALSFSLLLPPEGARVNVGWLYARGARAKGGLPSVLWDMVRRLRLFLQQVRC